LSVLQLLNEFHLDELHLHDFLLFVADEALFFLDLASDIGPSLSDFPAASVVSLLLGHLLIELDAALALKVQALDIL